MRIGNSCVKIADTQNWMPNSFQNVFIHQLVNINVQITVDFLILISCFHDWEVLLSSVLIFKEQIWLNIIFCFVQGEYFAKRVVMLMVTRWTNVSLNFHFDHFAYKQTTTDDIMSSMALSILCLTFIVLWYSCFIISKRHLTVI